MKDKLHYTVQIKNFYPQNKGNLVGFINVYIPELHWTIKGVGMFSKNGEHWVTPPSRQYKKDDGTVAYDWFIVMDDEHRKAFGEKCLSALNEYNNNDHPQKKTVQEEIPF